MQWGGVGGEKVTAGVQWEGVGRGWRGGQGGVQWEGVWRGWRGEGQGRGAVGGREWGRGEGEGFRAGVVVGVEEGRGGSQGRMWCDGSRVQIHWTGAAVATVTHLRE